MKKLLMSLIAMLSVVAARAEEVQYDRVNTALQVIADAVVFGDDQVEYAKPQFDEQFSDLKTEKIKYYLSGHLKNTPWLTGTKSDIRSSCIMRTDRNPVHLGIVATSEGEVETDVLALFRQGAITALKKVHSLPEKFEAKIKENLRRTAQVASLEELYPILLDSQELAIAIMSNELNDRKQLLLCLKSGSCTPSYPEQATYLERRVETLEKIIASNKTTKITVQPSTTKVDTILIENAQLEGMVEPSKYLQVIPESTQIQIKTSKVSAKASGFFPLKLEKLDKLKADLEKSLFDLQTGDLEMKEKTFRDFRTALFHFKEVINSELPR